jgi:predicted AAA+ superfamily ATPase
MDGLTERLLAMARGASHEQQDYLEVIERVLDQRQVDFDALAAEALDHFLESGARPRYRLGRGGHCFLVAEPGQ